MSLESRLTVGVSDAKVSRSSSDVIVTYSLGSCIGVCIYDERIKLGGMLHFQLPDSKLDENKAKIRPYMFADTGLAFLLNEMKNRGAQRGNLTVKLAGGAAMQNGPANFEIGKRNFIAIRKALWKAGLMISSTDVGGEVARTLYMQIETGKVVVKFAGTSKEL
ncbi:MAG: chemotaxis protein CheD [Pontiellaceae bacterium]|nr:chemotaxis protein CheD [Pontiellaceae bacterium]